MPGGASLHNCMSAHGPDSDAYQKAVGSNLKPVNIMTIRWHLCLNHANMAFNKNAFEGISDKKII